MSSISRVAEVIQKEITNKSIESLYTVCKVISDVSALVEHVFVGTISDPLYQGFNAAIKGPLKGFAAIVTIPDLATNTYKAAKFCLKTCSTDKTSWNHCAGAIMDVAGKALGLCNKVRDAVCLFEYMGSPVLQGFGKATAKIHMHILAVGTAVRATIAFEKVVAFVNRKDGADFGESYFFDQKKVTNTDAYSNALKVIDQVATCVFAVAVLTMAPLPVILVAAVVASVAKLVFLYMDSRQKLDQKAEFESGLKGIRECVQNKDSDLLEAEVLQQKVNALVTQCATLA